jgi:cytochrome c oxidase subunit 1/cytochrome c oxidase subunit I+III
LFSALLFAALAMKWWTVVAIMTAACAVSIAVWLWPERALIQREPAPVKEG